MQYSLQIPEDTKFDFQNIDVKLYLALKAILEKKDDAFLYEAAENSAKLALAEFELSLGPLPNWAIARNWDYSLVPGAQLCTKDGRVTGNAHILRYSEGIAAGPVHVPTFSCITDAGSYIKNLTEQEILSQYWVGEWVSDPKLLISRFGKRGEDYGDVSVQP